MKFSEPSPGREFALPIILKLALDYSHHRFRLAAFRPAILPVTKHSVIFPASRYKCPNEDPHSPTAKSRSICSP